MIPQSDLERALARCQDPAFNPTEILLDLREEPIQTLAEAEALCLALESLPAQPEVLPPCGVSSDEAPTTALYMLASLFQRAGSPEVMELLKERGLVALRKHYDLRLEGAGAAQRDDLLFVLKVLAMYQDPGGLERTVAAVRAGLWAEDFLWLTVFEVYHAPHVLCLELAEGLREPLPEGLAAVGYLDHVNTLTLQGVLEGHPFDTPAGIALLEAWLSTGGASFAHSATAALPFLNPASREPLLTLALEHADPRVRLEAGWAAATLGDAKGVELLVRACSDPRISRIAQAYLQEVGHPEQVPASVEEPDFKAQAELAHWLAHPQGFGRSPDAVELYDRRSLTWPPTEDERELWLVRFRFEPMGPEDAPTEGLGLVGSETRVLPGEVRADMDPAEAYALHCCWELEEKGDPRAPATRTVAAGLALLGLTPEGESSGGPRRLPQA